MRSNPQHISVLPDELLDLMKSEEGFQLRSFLDATLGAGGHSELLLRAHPLIDRYFAIDQDLSALQSAQADLTGANLLPKNAHFWHANFSDAPALLAGQSALCDAILLDLGVSSMQLASPDRGFSVRGDAPLDMRMNQLDDLTAKRLVNKMPQKKMEQLLRSLEVKSAGRIAKAICDARIRYSIETTAQLIAITRPFLGKSGKIHPATLLFQALRIAVNDELGHLQNSLESLALKLTAGGKIAVISFHSLEDRIVKTTFRRLCSGGGFTSLTKKPLMASSEEKSSNRKSRSAKLRAIARIDDRV